MTTGLMNYNHLQSFVNFVGWARTGHSLVGALLDSHPNMIISHEEYVLKKFRLKKFNNKKHVFDRIIKNSQRNLDRGRPASGEYYQKIEDSYQGIVDNKLKIIGDKKGGGSIIEFRRDREILDKFTNFIELPLKLILVLRNPLDSISTSLTKRPTTFKNRLRIYKSTFNLIDQLLKKNYDIYIIRFEDLILNFDYEWKKLLNFLEINYSNEYINSCKSIVFDKVPKSRYKLDWDQTSLDMLKKEMSNFKFLRSYLNDIYV